MARMVTGDAKISTADLKVKIGNNNQQVVLDGVDISKYVVGVSINTGEGSLSAANLELSTNTEFESDAIKLITKFTNEGRAFVDNIDRAIIHVLPGDALVLKCKCPVSDNAIECLKKYLKPKFPDNPIIVLDDNAELYVIRKEDANGYNGQD